MDHLPFFAHLWMRLKARWPALILALAILASFFVPAWGHTSGRIMSYGQDFAHFPLFAAIVAVLLYLWPRRQSAYAKAGMVVGIAVMTAIIVELIQPLAGRTCALSDALIGFAGSSAAACVYLGAKSVSPRARVRLVGTALLLLFVAGLPVALMVNDQYFAWRAFPMIDSFERPVESTRWKSDGCRLDQVEEHATHGRYALRLSIPSDEGGAPGALLYDGTMDWRGYRQITLDAFLESKIDRNLILRIDDHLWAPLSDRAQVVVELKPGANRLAIDLPSFFITSGGRTLDVSRIQGIGLYLDQSKSGEALFVDNLQLGGRDSAFHR